MLAGNGDSTSQPTCGTAPSADNQPRRQIRLNIGDWNKRKEGKMKLTYYPSRPYHYFLYLYLPPPPPTSSLGYLLDWVEPRDDGMTLPAMSFRTIVYEMRLRLPWRTDHLKRVGRWDSGRSGTHTHTSSDILHGPPTAL